MTEQENYNNYLSKKRELREEEIIILEKMKQVNQILQKYKTELSNLRMDLAVIRQEQHSQKIKTNIEFTRLVRW
jgi:hypothetical protein